MAWLIFVRGPLDGLIRDVGNPACGGCRLAITVRGLRGVYTSRGNVPIGTTSVTVEHGYNMPKGCIVWEMCIAGEDR